MKEIKKIDIHAHASLFPDLIPPHKPSGSYMPGTEQLLEMYDRLNIEMGVLLPIISPEGQWSQISIESCKVMADANPDRFVWFCNIDPRSAQNDVESDLGYLLEHYKKLGARGVGELTSNLYPDDPKMEHLFACCEEAEMPVMIHISPKEGYNYGIVDDLGLPRLEQVLKNHPKLKIIGHSQPFWAEISGDLTEEIRNKYPGGKVTDGTLARLLRTYDNLYCDLSAGSGCNALTRDPEYAAGFLAEFSDRILFGCDICATFNTHPFRLDAFLDQLVADGALRMDHYKKIVRENAVKLLKLSE